MKYYNVTSSRDGEAWCFNGVDVPESALESLRRVFGESGVVLHAKFTRTIADRPLYIKDPETGRLVKDDEL